MNKASSLSLRAARRKFWASSRESVRGSLYFRGLREHYEGCERRPWSGRWGKLFLFMTRMRTDEGVAA